MSLRPLKVTHICQYTGNHFNMCLGDLYDCEEVGDYFRCVGTDGQMMRMPQGDMIIIQELDDCGTPSIPQGMISGKDYSAKKKACAKSKQEALDEVMDKIARRSAGLPVDGDDPLGGPHLYGPGGIIRDFGLQSESHTIFDAVIADKSISRKELPDAPAYKHQNATRKTRDTQQDTKSTEELRKYRFTPES